MKATPQALVEALVRLDVTHVMGIPDNTSGPLFDALAAQSVVRLVPVTREGEAFAIASGLWLGSARPLVLIQNTGLMESGDALRGTAIRMGAPVPIVVTGRGYAGLARSGVRPGATPTPELLRRPEVDSVALITEPTLDAWGVPWLRCTDPSELEEMLERTVRRARSDEHPAALILAAGLS